MSHVEALYRLYCQLTGQELSLPYDRQRLWFEFLSGGFDTEHFGARSTQPSNSTTAFRPAKKKRFALAPSQEQALYVKRLRAPDPFL